MTRDIDLVVERSADDADRFCALFEGEFYLDRGAVRAAAADRSVFNLIHQAYVIKVDCIVRKDSEYRSARQRLEGHPAYDFGWMWGELRLDRPGP